MASGVEKFLMKVLLYTLVAFWGVFMLIKMMVLTFIEIYKSWFADVEMDLPECTLDSDLGEHNTVNILYKSETLKIKYVSNGVKDGPLLLMLHGFPECWYSWRYQLKDAELRKKYRMVAIDLPGFGESYTPSRLEDYSTTALSDVFAAVIKSLGYEKAVVCAHDWGAVVTWRFVTNYPELCEKVVIMNGPHERAYQSQISASPKQLLLSWYVFFYQWPYLPEIFMGMNNFASLRDVFLGKATGLKNKHNLTDSDFDVYKYALRKFKSRTSAINLYRAVFHGMRPPNASHSRQSSKIKTPLMVIWGTEDGALDLEIASKSASYADDCKLEFIHGSSHFIQQDFPERVNQLMRVFLI